MLKDFILLETVGKGSFASVHKVIRKSDNKVYALKRVKINKMTKKEIADTLNEIRFLSSIRHKNIVGFLEAFLENNETELCIIMEYCSCGDLAQKVERYKRRRQYIDENVIWRYLVQCLKALQVLHEKGICHRDIKVANTFLGEDGSVKIGDMNVSKRLKKGQLQTQIGTPYYMSPEIWNQRPYDASSDIWSLGCLLYELCALRPPFLGDSFPTLKRAILAGRYPTIPKKYSDCLSKVIGMMLKVNAKERPTADALLKSTDLASKLQFDDGHPLAAIRQDVVTNLMETIKVPPNLRHLNNALPKPCYPDVRPNSPSAWIVNDQNMRPPIPPPKPPALLEKIQKNPNSVDDIENCPGGVNRNEKYQQPPPIPPVKVVFQPATDDIRKIIPSAPFVRPQNNFMQPSNNLPEKQQPNAPQRAVHPIAPLGYRPAGAPARHYHHRMW